MAVLVLAAWLAQTWTMEGSAVPVPMRAPQGGGQWPAVSILCGLALLGCFKGAFGVGFRWLLLGIVSAVALAWTTVLARHCLPWSSGLLGWPVLLAFFALVFLHALLAATRSTFKSGRLRIRDGGDHLSIGKDSGEMTVFPQGRALCRYGPEFRSETRYGGGTYTIPTTSTITTYGPNGIGYGTVSGSQMVSTPVFSYETSVKTSRVDFRLEEVGPDHALLTAARPQHVHIQARHTEHHRGKSAHFTLGPWAAFRFNVWRRLHAKTFFHKDGSLPRRIAKAASTHVARMKERYGRTQARELTMDHELRLLSFVALAKNEIFVCLGESDTSLVIGRQDAHRYWVDDAIHVPGCTTTIWPGGRIKAAISEWAQLATLRLGDGGPRRDLPD